MIPVNTKPQSANGHKLNEKGGKLLHLELLKGGGFKIPDTYSKADSPYHLLPADIKYVVRSSAASEDSQNATSAGKYNSELAISRDQLSSVVQWVSSAYVGGNVVIQPDLSERMQYSGVIYTNLNGKMIISMGPNNSVQSIVKGIEPKTRITISSTDTTMDGLHVDSQLVNVIQSDALKVERYFGIPMDIEFTIIENKMVFLQSRPLPSPTETALKVHELRRLNDELQNLHKLGLGEIVLGVGNYREILGDSAATELSVSTFNYIFTGDGKSTLGAVQLGRNSLGYEVGYEAYPWTVMLGGTVYYNFAGDAFQFRPANFGLDNYSNVMNQIYLKKVAENPDMLNYPELRLYVQFPEQAEGHGLPTEPYSKLADANRSKISSLQMPSNPPERMAMERFENASDCLEKIRLHTDSIRTTSASDYVRAARLAFFALEDVRIEIDKLKERDLGSFSSLCSHFGVHSAEKLRDSIVYDESIRSFATPNEERFKYQGSFEISLPRGFTPNSREFKKGMAISDVDLSSKVVTARMALEYREKMKFFLHRDYEALRQLYENLGSLTGLNGDVYRLQLNELELAITEPILAGYRITLRKKVKERPNLFGEPIFLSELMRGKKADFKARPELVFGLLDDGKHKFAIGSDVQIISAVDQTVEPGEEAKIILVPTNIRPGSHLFTLLSDYEIPVVTVPKELLTDLGLKSEVTIVKKGDEIELICN